MNKHILFVMRNLDNPELTHQQKAEIAKLKQTVNKLRMKGE